MKKVLIVTPYAKDANSFWRCMGPWGYLEKESRKLGIPNLGEVELVLAQDEIGIKDGVNWSTVSRFDLVFMHRPCRPDDLTILKLAKLENVPVWVDYDDWLFELPFWNPNQVYHDVGIQTIMASCMAAADVVSVSTGALYEKIKKINENTVIIPNAYRTDLFGYRQEKVQPRQAIYTWRGTNTHDADLLSVAEGFSELPGRIFFLGSPTWQIYGRLKKDQVQLVGGQDNLLYLKYLYDLKPKVMLFPLVDCYFNRCKSNIAWMEALHAGALCVAPDLPEWRKPGCVTYKPGDSASFHQAALDAFNLDPMEHENTVEQAYAEMKQMYGIEWVNQIRQQVLTSIFEPSFRRNTRDPWDQLTGLWALSQMRPMPQIQASPEIMKEKGLI